MNKCKRIKKQLVLFVSNELKKDSKHNNEVHLKTCQGCNNEYQIIKKITNQVDELDIENEKIIETIDWDDVTATISSRVRSVPSQVSKRFSVNLSNWKVLVPVGMTVFILGIAVGFLLFQTGSNNLELEKFKLEPELSLTRIESALDKKEVINYLKQSQLILTDLMKQSDHRESVSISKNLHIKKAKYLLRQNRYFKKNLNDPSLFIARNLIQKIEWLLIEILSMDQDISTDDLYRLQLFIEREKLLLKIRLIEKELTYQKKASHKKYSEV